MGITTQGKDLVLDQLNGATSTPINTMGVGTDSTAFNAAQIKLNPTVAGSVSLLALDATFPTRTAEVATYQRTYAAGTATFAWNEIGLFNGTTNGTSKMLNRIVIGPYTKAASDTIVAIVTITQA